MLGSASSIPRRAPRTLVGRPVDDGGPGTRLENLRGTVRRDAATPVENPGPVTTGSPSEGSGASPNEAVLLAGLRARNPASYEDLVRTHGGRMLAVARRFLRNEADARDCVQDACLLAFRQIHSFEGRASVGTWLHRIVVNAALMRIRSRRTRPEEPLDALLPEFDALGNRLEPSTAMGPPVDILLQRREVRDRVRQAIDRLPESYRTVLLLRDIEEYDTEETARLLEMTPANVKTRLHRARAAFKTLIDPVLSEGEP